MRYNDSRIANDTHPNKWNAFRIVALFICLLGFGFQFSFQVARLLAKEKISVDEEIELNGFRFPDVTVCPNNPFDTFKFNANGITPLYYQLYNIWRTILGQSAQVPLTDSFETETRSWRLAEQSMRVHIKRENKTQSLYRLIENQLVFCRYGGSLCGPANFTLLSHPNRLACFVFRPIDQRARIIAEKEDISGGLYFVLNQAGMTSFRAPHETLYQNSGYTIAIHAPNSNPQLSSGRIPAYANRETNIGLEMSKTVAINAPLEPCIESSSANNIFNMGSKTSENKNDIIQQKEDCRAEQLQTTLATDCGCVDEYLVRSSEPPANLPFCHQLPIHMITSPDIPVWSAEVRLNLYHGGDKSLYYFDDEIKKYGIVDKMNCHLKTIQRFSSFYIQDQNCKTSCDTYEYKTTHVISNHWSPNLAESKRILDYFSTVTGSNNTPGRKSQILQAKNLIAIRIYPDSLVSRTTRRKLDYTLSEFANELGGVLGLWLGWSIIMGFELLNCICRWWCKNSASRQSRNNVTRRPTPICSLGSIEGRKSYFTDF